MINRCLSDIKSNYFIDLVIIMFFRVGVQLPTVEVRYKNLCVESECEIVQGKPLPTLWNTAKSILSVSICM